MNSNNNNKNVVFEDENDHEQVDAVPLSLFSVIYLEKNV